MPIHQNITQLKIEIITLVAGFNFVFFLVNLRKQIFMFNYLYFRNNNFIMSLIEENNQVIIPIMFPVLYLYGDAIQHQEHDGNENLIVLLNEPQNVIVIPEKTKLALQPQKELE